jgi:hypothetical protein
MKIPSFKTLLGVYFIIYLFCYVYEGGVLTVGLAYLGRDSSAPTFLMMGRWTAPDIFGSSRKT